jgi:hypothetical protein
MDITSPPKTLFYRDPLLLAGRLGNDPVDFKQEYREYAA